MNEPAQAQPEPIIKAIETKWNGYRFRSRLEARWAVFLSELDVGFQYEPEGFELPSGRYLPDFYLPDHETFLEIKPGNFDGRASSLLFDLSLASGCDCIALSGPPDYSMYQGVFVPSKDRYILFSVFLDPYSKRSSHVAALTTTGRFTAYEAVFTMKSVNGIHKHEINVGDSPTPSTRYIKAIAKSRSARFEFGEKP